MTTNDERAARDKCLVRFLESPKPCYNEQMKPMPQRVWFRRRWPTVMDLERIGDAIMSAISDFAAKQNAHNDRVDTALTGIQGDVKFLQDTIDKLQNSPGSITPEDQALLDALDARADVTASKLEALDALNPPVPPTT